MQNKILNQLLKKSHINILSRIPIKTYGFMKKMPKKSFKPLSFTKSIFNIKPLSFSTLPKQTLGCIKIQESANELFSTLDANFSDILRVMPNRGMTVSALLYYDLAYIGNRNITAYDILSDNILQGLNQSKDLSTIINVLEGLHYKISNREIIQEKETLLLEATLTRIIELNPLLKESQRKNIISMIEDIAIVSEYHGYQKYIDKLTIKNPTTINDILKVLEVDELANDVQDTLEIKDINLEKNFFVIKSKKTNKQVIIFGCEANPSDSLNIITKFIEQSAKKINYLLLEDAPMVVEPSIGPEERASPLEKMEYFKKNSKVYYEIEGDNLKEYLATYLTETELFSFDTVKDVIMTTYNSKIKLPNEVATIAYKFNKFADQPKHPKIKLTDMNMTEMMGYLIRELSLTELRSLVELMSYVTLVEKTKFAVQSIKEGCSLCNKNKPQSFPKDLVSAVSGDKEYPLHEKASFFGRQVFDAINQPTKTDHNIILGVFGSFHYLGILQHIIKLAYEDKRNPVPELNREEYYNTMSKHISDGHERNRNELYEKIAILETIHQNIDPAAFKALNLEKEDINFHKYGEYVDKYAYVMSYEKLMEKNPKSNEIKISPGDCIAESLIFGELAPGEYTLRDDNNEEQIELDEEAENDDDRRRRSSSNQNKILKDKLSKIQIQEQNHTQNQIQSRYENQNENDDDDGKIRIKDDKPKRKRK